MGSVKKEKSETIGINTDRDIKTGKFLPGNSAGGRTKGSKDFYTDFKNAIKQIKDKNTGEELTETHIIKIGLEKMLKGDARFEGLYKDLLDRVYGKPVSTVNVDADIKTEESLTKKDKEKLLSLLDDKRSTQ